MNNDLHDHLRGRVFGGSGFMGAPRSFGEAAGMAEKQRADDARKTVPVYGGNSGGTFGEKLLGIVALGAFMGVIYGGSKLIDHLPVEKLRHAISNTQGKTHKTLETKSEQEPKRVSPHQEITTTKPARTPDISTQYLRAVSEWFTPLGVKGREGIKVPLAQNVVLNKGYGELECALPKGFEVAIGKAGKTKSGEIIGAVVFENGLCPTTGRKLGTNIKDGSNVIQYLPVTLPDSATPVRPSTPQLGTVKGYDQQ